MNVREPVFQVNVRLPAPPHQWLKEEARRLDRSVNWLVNRLIEDAHKQAAQAKQEVVR